MTYSIAGRIPTVNHAYRVAGGRIYKTAEAKAYARMIAAEYRAQGGRGLPKCGAWRIDVIFRIWDRRDLDNCIKVFLDAVKDAVKVDDRWCYELHAYKAGHHDPSGKRDLVEFTITPVEVGLCETKKGKPWRMKR